MKNYCKKHLKPKPYPDFVNKIEDPLFNKSNRDNLKSNQGFSLVETLVAISILLMAITGTLTIASRSIAVSANSKDKITAFFLASEAVEFVRNTRDNNALSGNPSWLSGLSSCTNGCTVDSPNNTIVSCIGECPYLFRTEAGVYNQSNGEETIFRRTVSIIEVVPSREAIITVETKWQRKLTERTIILEEHLFNWQ